MAYDTEEHHTIFNFHDNNTHLYLLSSCFIMFHSTVVVSNDDKGSWNELSKLMYLFLGTSLVPPWEFYGSSRGSAKASWLDLTLLFVMNNWFALVACYESIWFALSLTHLAWPSTILENDNIIISWDFLRLTAPAAMLGHLGAVSLKKISWYHNITFL